MLSSTVKVITIQSDNYFITVTLMLIFFVAISLRNDSVMTVIACLTTVCIGEIFSGI